MGSLFRCALGLALVATVHSPAGAQGARCSLDALTVDGSAVSASFCVPPDAGPPSVNVTETFRAGGQTLTRNVPLAVVAGARVSRTIDDVDFHPLGLKRSLHMTLAYTGGAVVLEHALALPGATPVK